MDKKGEMSSLKAWLITFVSLLDEIVILALIFLGLWFFNVEMSWWIILIAVVMVAVFGFFMHRSIVPAIRRRKIHGAEAMVGKSGWVLTPCSPSGTVKIEGECWNAISVTGIIDTGEEIEVTAINGLNLEVRSRKKQS